MQPGGDTEQKKKEKEKKQRNMQHHSVNWMSNSALHSVPQEECNKNQESTLSRCLSFLKYRY